jgi:hypothetical protein
MRYTVTIRVLGPTVGGPSRPSAGTTTLGVVLALALFGATLPPPGVVQADAECALEGVQLWQGPDATAWARWASTIVIDGPQASGWCVELRDKYLSTQSVSDDEGFHTGLTDVGTADPDSEPLDSEDQRCIYQDGSGTTLTVYETGSPLLPVLSNDGGVSQPVDAQTEMHNGDPNPYCHLLSQEPGLLGVG